MPINVEGFWLTWDSIRNAINGRKVYLYGRSEDWVHKAIPRLPNQVFGIIDRETEYHGKIYKGLKVIPFEEVESKEDCYFVITAGDFDGIVENLMNNGMVPGVDFSCSPDFRDYQALSKIKSHEARILFSSSDYNDVTRARGSKVGGGLFILDMPSGNVERVAVGSFRQFEICGDYIYAVEYVEKYLVKFDLNFNIITKKSLDKPNFCGLAINKEDKKIYLANAGTDEIYEYNLDNLDFLNKRRFSTNELGAEHHVNDLCYFDGFLYCSYFSYCGGFKRGVFDGGVAAINLGKPDQMPVELIGGLWKPHTPSFVDGKLVVLDSMRGRLVSGSPKPITRLSGFVRGMCKHERYWIIGQSEDMYVTDRMSSTEDAVVLNSGIYIYDDESASAYFYVTPGTMNIHCITHLNR
ncbi:hypothetical protein [Thalassospira sp. MCCC 1A03138]|uniref:hypothetical protein n=1 Tax=Thalassospira sp. MCCC 1A03138 TaxID=1470576 RepID=UPI000A1E7CBD|nr:hypothetical protein [Thalassospira sp. MCCC 1A03138]OSQ27342.1 hypothetical protein TH468_20765 [Thalassospira sp. MCCC 1A03138]